MLNSKPENIFREHWLWCDQKKISTIGQLASLDEIAYNGTYIEYPLSWTSRSKEEAPVMDRPFGKRAALSRISAWITYMCIEKGVQTISKEENLKLTPLDLETYLAYTLPRLKTFQSQQARVVPDL